VPDEQRVIEEMAGAGPVAEQAQRMAEQVFWMQVRRLRPAVSPQTARSVNSQKAASLPGRLP